MLRVVASCVDIPEIGGGVALSTSKSVWKTHHKWMCLAHVPPLALPAATEECYMRGCSHRPPEADRPEFVAEPEPRKPVIPAGVEMCAWEKCDKPSRPSSKYCSRRCSNKNARKRFRERGRDAA